MQTKIVQPQQEAKARARVERFRKGNNRSLPGWYHWLLHFVANISLLGGGIAVGIYFSPSFSLRTLAIFCVFLFVWSFIEYGLHRFILHGKAFRKTKLFKGHAGSHHSYFNHHHMVLEEPQDLNRVMLFTSDLLSLIIVNLLLGGIVALLLGVDLGAVAFLSGMAYISAHEFMHWFCHGEKGFELRIFRFFAHHHWIHHDQRIMGKYNFGVVTPFWDWILGTTAPPEISQRSREPKPPSQELNDVPIRAD